MQSLFTSWVARLSLIWDFSITLSSPGAGEENSQQWDELDHEGIGLPERAPRARERHPPRQHVPGWEGQGHHQRGQGPWRGKAQEEQPVQERGGLSRGAAVPGMLVSCWTEVGYGEDLGQAALVISWDDRVIKECQALKRADVQLPSGASCSTFAWSVSCRPTSPLHLWCWRCWISWWMPSRSTSSKLQPWGAAAVPSRLSTSSTLWTNQ